jgi:hypothetical protein
MYLGQAGNTAVNNSSKSFHHDNMKGIISGSKWRLLLLISLGIMIARNSIRTWPSRSTALIGRGQGLPGNPGSVLALEHAGWPQERL